MRSDSVVCVFVCGNIHRLVNEMLLVKYVNMPYVRFEVGHKTLRSNRECESFWQFRSCWIMNVWLESIVSQRILIVFVKNIQP